MAAKRGRQGACCCQEPSFDPHYSIGTNTLHGKILAGSDAALQHLMLSKERLMHGAMADISCCCPHSRWIGSHVFSERGWLFPSGLSLQVCVHQFAVGVKIVRQLISHRVRNIHELIERSCSNPTEGCPLCHTTFIQQTRLLSYSSDRFIALADEWRKWKKIRVSRNSESWRLTLES